MNDTTNIAAVPNHSQVQFRMACHADLEQIIPINNQYYDCWSNENFSQAIEQNLPFIVILNSQQEILGYLVYLVCLDELRIINVTVAKKHQGNGYAKLLMSCAFEQVIPLAIRWALLDVRVSNTRAVSLYKHLGFQILCRRAEYYTELANEDAYFMQLKIPSNPGGILSNAA